MLRAATFATYSPFTFLLFLNLKQDKRDVQRGGNGKGKRVGGSVRSQDWDLKP